MIDPRQISPLLNNISVLGQIGSGPNGAVYLCQRRSDGAKLALKHISIPASEEQTQALIYSGAVSNASEAHQYYGILAEEIKAELLALNNLERHDRLLRYQRYQSVPKPTHIGYDVYLLTGYCRSLPAYLAKHPLTHLTAVNLALDICSALEQLRTANLVHKDVRPTNIFVGSKRSFLLGDLGIVAVDELKYNSLPDKLISNYTAPEVRDVASTLSDTMDIYSLGVILYEIFNGGELPLNEDGRFAPVANAPLAPPQYADGAMAEIILRACAYRPEDRYQSPSDMKQDLVLYLQRGDVADTPIVPVPEPEPEAAPAPEGEPDADGEAPAEGESAPAASESSIDVNAIAAAIAIAEDDPDAPQVPIAAEFPEEPVAPPEPEEPQRSLNDLTEDELLLPTSGEISVEDFMSALMKTPGLEVMSMDSEGNMSVVPGYETEATLPDNTEFVDSADNHFAALQDMGTINGVPVSESSAAEGASDTPDKVSATVEAVSAKVNAEAEDPAPSTAEDEALSAPPRPRRRPRPQERIDEYEAEEEEYDDYDEDEPRSGSTWKKVLIVLIVLLVLAGGSFAAYTFKTDTINSITSGVLSSTSVMVSADTKNDSPMEVICSTAAGEVARLPYSYADGGVTFTGLSPDTTYTFTMSSTDGKFLLGSRSVSGKTLQMTNLNAFGASSVSAVSATLKLSGTGQVPEEWVITLTPDSGDVITVTSPDTTITAEGLTPDTEYTAEIARGDGDLLGGTTTCTFRTMEYTVLADFAATGIESNSISVAWTYTGTVPDTWVVTCDGADGSSYSQEVTGNEVTFDGLASGVDFTISVNCPSLKPTDISSIVVGTPSVIVTEVSSDTDDDGNIVVDWEYTSNNITPSTWDISYYYEMSNGVSETFMATSDTNSVVLDDLVPNANYHITISGADALTVGGEATTICKSGAADTYTDYGASDPELTLFSTNDTSTPMSSFATDDHISFQLEIYYDATEEDKTVSSTYIIRDSDGNPYAVYEGSPRSFSGTWVLARRSGDLPDCIEVPGSYKLEIYFNGDFVASESFTVS